MSEFVFLGSKTDAYTVLEFYRARYPEVVEWLETTMKEESGNG